MLSAFRVVLSAAIVCTAPSTAAAQTQTPYVIEPSVLAATQPGVDPKTATLTSQADAAELIARTIGDRYKNTFDLKHPDTYVVVHVVRWSDPAVPPPTVSKDDLDAAVQDVSAAKRNVEAARGRFDASATDDTRRALAEAMQSYADALGTLAGMSHAIADTPAPHQTVEIDNWYVYNGSRRWTLEDFTKNKRTFGVARLWLLYVHVNLFAPNGEARLRTYHPTYVVTDAPKISTPLQHFAILAKLFPNFAALGPGGATSTIAVWGAREISVHSPSDLTFVAKLAADDPANQTKDPLPLGDEIKIDNEGRYRFDFGLAVPIRSVKDLTKDEEIGAVAPKVISTANAFATIDVYFKKVDLKDPGVRRIPHLVAGISITDTDKPFQTFFVGGGWGPAIANFYAGWLRLRLIDDPEGRKYQNEFTFGVELPLVNAVLKRLK